MVHVIDEQTQHNSVFSDCRSFLPKTILMQWSNQQDKATQHKIHCQGPQPAYPLLDKLILTLRQFAWLILAVGRRHVVFVFLSRKSLNKMSSLLCAICKWTGLVVILNASDLNVWFTQSTQPPEKKKKKKKKNKWNKLLKITYRFNLAFISIVT